MDACMDGCIDACICLRLQKVMLELHMSDAIQYLELCFLDAKTQPGRRPVFYYEMALDISVRTEFCFLNSFVFPFLHQFLSLCRTNWTTRSHGRLPCACAGCSFCCVPYRGCLHCGTLGRGQKRSTS